MGFSPLCADASSKVCLLKNQTKRTSSQTKTSASSIDEEDYMNLRNSVILDPIPVSAF